MRDGSPPRAPAAGDEPVLPTIDKAHYAIASELARGGMGRIFLARDRRLGRTVAVKEVLATEDAFLVRFDREVRLTARLQHPGIVSIYEAGRWPTGEPFYAMRLIAGRPLSSVIAETATLAERLALVPHVLAVAEALAYAHDQRIIHRDLKPANVLVGTFGETVVIDWGLAKDLDDGATEETRPFQDAGEGALTMLGAVMGTPSYMPIEQATGKPVDERADVYAIGAILYETLCGKPPYEGPTSMSILDKLIAEQPASLHERVRGVPGDLLAIVKRALARDAEARYRTAKALAEDLKRFLTGQLVASHAYTRGELVRRWLRKYRTPVAISAIAALVLLGVGLASYLRVVSARDRADAALGEAQQAKVVADAARAREVKRADELTVAQARSLVKTDPTAALAWLAQLTSEGAPYRAAAMIAADARARGVAWVLSTGDKLHAVVASPDGKRAVACTNAGALEAEVAAEATRPILAVADHVDLLVERDIRDDGVPGPQRHLGEVAVLAYAVGRHRGRRHGDVEHAQAGLVADHHGVVVGEEREAVAVRRHVQVHARRAARVARVHRPRGRDVGEVGAIRRERVRALARSWGRRRRRADRPHRDPGV